MTGWDDDLGERRVPITSRLWEIADSRPVDRRDDVGTLLALQDHLGFASGTCHYGLGDVEDHIYAVAAVALRFLDACARERQHEARHG